MLNHLLLQVNLTSATTTDTAHKAATGVATLATGEAPATASLSLLDLMFKGGVVMIPILLLFIIAVYVFIERLLTITRSGKTDSNFIHNIKDLVLNGNIDAAKAFCKSANLPQARMIEKGISRLGKPVKDIEMAMQDAGKLEIYRLEKNLSVLSIIGRIAPMLGFIGTIIGVINIFYKISLSKVVEIDVISEGLYQKMITSASGLGLGIFAFVCYNILTLMVDRIINRMEASSIEFMDILHQPGK